jgi:hypothetical protein
MHPGRRPPSRLDVSKYPNTVQKYSIRIFCSSSHPIPSTNVVEESMTMNQIQRWMNTIAGVTRAERARREFAREIFGRKPLDLSVLQAPVCWRRKCQPGRRSMA